MIDVQRTDFVAVPVQDRDRAATFYGETLVSPEMLGAPFTALPVGSVVFRVEFLVESWDSGVCHGAAFKDPEGNGLALHHRYEPYPDGTTP